MNIGLKYFNKGVQETLKDLKDLMSEVDLTPTAWIEKRKAEGKEWSYTKDSFYPAMVGAASVVVRRAAYLFENRWPDFMKEFEELDAKADKFDTIFGDLDEEDLRKLLVLMSCGDHHDRKRLLRAMQKSISVVDDMEDEEALNVVNVVFTEDPDDPGNRWTGAEGEELTLNEKREFTYVKDGVAKVLRFHEIPVFFADAFDVAEKRAHQKRMTL